MIMNMAENRPRPTPKPRMRQTLPASTANHVGHISSTFSSNKPATKPKPVGYKTLDYSNKGLVFVQRDIDIEERPSVDHRTEQNNNIVSITNISETGDKDKVTKSNTAGTIQAYNKPLPPPPPDEDVPVFQESNTSFNKKISSNAKLKPARMSHFYSDSQLDIVQTEQEHTSNSIAEKSSTSPRSKVGHSNPPIPRKPVVLKPSKTENKPDILCGDHIKGKSLLQTNNNDKIVDKKTPPLPRKPTLISGSMSSSISSLHTPGFSKVKENSNQRNSSSANPAHGLLCPRKPIRGQTVPERPIDLAKQLPSSSTNRCVSPSKAKLPLDLTETTEASGNEISLSRTAHNRTARRHSSSSATDNDHLTKRRSRLSANLSFDTSTEDESTEDTKISKSRRKAPRPPTPTQLPAKPPRVKSSPTKQLPSIPSPQKFLPPSNPPPPPPNSVPSNPPLSSSPPKSHPPPPPKQPPPTLSPLPVRSGSRRQPPPRPKQPSLTKGRNKPPVPQAPKPTSVTSDKTPLGMQKSLSAGDLADADGTYWVAYQHLRESVGEVVDSKGSDKESSHDDDYVFPDAKSVEEFLESTSQKTRSGPKSMKYCNEKTKSPIQRKRLDRRSTYSLSSDDSGAYVDVDQVNLDILNQQESSSQVSDDHETYIEAIHTEADPVVSPKAKTNKFEFQPFDNTDFKMTEPKIIDWDYTGDSDDSEASYCEPHDDQYEDGDVENEEPLYQIYQATVLEKQRTLSLKRVKKNSHSEVSPTSPGNVTLRTGTLRGGRMLWSQLPEVRNSGLLEGIDGDQRKLQEAIFEMISSEVSYLKSLHLLVDHFISSKVFDNILNQTQISELFSNIQEIINASERFLEDLRSRQRQSIVVESISDIISDHATNNFEPYVTYCSTQYKQDRMLRELKQNHLKFPDVLQERESDSRLLGLPLQSFLVLPMQRVTRYPLLVDAIIRRCEPGHEAYYKTDAALKAVNQVVYKCNEGARKEERYEEMVQIEKLITFLKVESTEGEEKFEKRVKFYDKPFNEPIELVTKDRWLLRRGPLQLLEFDMKSTISNTLHRRFRKYRVKNIFLFLFNDLLVVTKKKSETLYSVIDFASRNMIRVQESKSNTKNSFILVFLENHAKKTKELNVRVENETDLTRWRDAFEPPEPEDDDEKIYGTWDCPQVHARHNYQAKQSDELSLVPGDVVNVLRKLPDGWYEGERLRDGVCGWFPANHTDEIRNEHVRARNLHQRYRLLAASTAFLDKRKR